MKTLTGLQKSLGGLQTALTKAKEGGQYQDVPCGRILIRPQVRTKGLTPEALQEMAASIRQVGVMQPILIRPLAGNPDFDYELVAGERRLRGSMLDERETCPSIVKHITDDEAKRIQRIENVQREALSDAEILEAVKEDLAELGKASLVAERWSKSESWVSKILELDSLGDVTQQLVEQGLSGDREVLTTVNRIEKKDAQAAAAVVKQIAADPGANVRQIVKNAISKAKSEGGKGVVPAGVGKGAQKAGKGPGRAEPADTKSRTLPGIPAAPKRAPTVRDALASAFYAVVESRVKPNKALAEFDGIKSEIVSHLEGWWKQGRDAKKGKTVSEEMVAGLMGGSFAPDGAECYTLIAFVDGAQGVAFDLVAILGKAAAVAD